MSKEFLISREETVHYHLYYTKDEIVDAMAFCLGEGDEQREAAFRKALSSLSDEKLLQHFRDELDRQEFLYEYIMERSERHGDVQSNDLSVELLGG